MIAGFYCNIYMAAVKVAYKRGYCIAAHGSMNRDLDLVAVPWTKGAVSPDALINALARELKITKAGVLSEKPHGRMAQVFLFPKDYGEFGHHYIDLSIMPRLEKKAPK